MKKGMLAGISLVAGFAGGAAVERIERYRQKSDADNEVAFYKKCYDIVCKWMSLKQNGNSLEKYFKQRGYHAIAIYGMGKMGGMLYEDLKDSDIQVKYGIAQGTYCTYPGLRIIKPKDKMDKVDVIVVTPFSAFDEIEMLISEKTDIPVISIEEMMIYDIN